VKEGGRIYGRGLRMTRGEDGVAVAEKRNWEAGLSEWEEHSFQESNADEIIREDHFNGGEYHPSDLSVSLSFLEGCGKESRSECAHFKTIRSNRVSSLRSF
jgi:hypothetical protein